MTSRGFLGRCDSGSEPAPGWGSGVGPDPSAAAVPDADRGSGGAGDPSAETRVSPTCEAGIPVSSDGIQRVRMTTPRTHTASPTMVYAPSCSPRKTAAMSAVKSGEAATIGMTTEIVLTRSA